MFNLAQEIKKIETAQAVTDKKVDQILVNQAEQTKILTEILIQFGPGGASEQKIILGEPIAPTPPDPQPEQTPQPVP